MDNLNVLIRCLLLASLQALTLSCPINYRYDILWCFFGTVLEQKFVWSPALKNTIFAYIHITFVRDANMNAVQLNT